MLVSICGIAVIDIVIANLPRLAKPGELIFTPIHCCVGGHACNVSMDLVQMGTESKEISVIIPVGNDVFGNFLEEELERIGVVTHFHKTDSPTSKDVILVVKGEDRRFHVDVGANLQLSYPYVQKSLQEDRPSMFYIGGVGMLGETDDKLVEVCREAKESGSVVFVDVVTPYRKEWSFINPAFEWIDIFHCNDFEAKKITGEKNLTDAVKRISDLGVNATLVTQGKGGLTAIVSGTRLTMPAFNIDPVDPSGAGDAFCAGILHKLTRGPYFKLLKKKGDLSFLTPEEWKKLLIYSSACGAVCCRAVGTTTSVRSSYVESLIQEQGDQVSRRTEIIELAT